LILRIPRVVLPWRGQTRYPLDSSSQVQLEQTKTTQTFYADLAQNFDKGALRYAWINSVKTKDVMTALFSKSDLELSVT